MYDQWEQLDSAGVERLGRQMWEHLDATLHRIYERSNIVLCIDEVEKQYDSLHGEEYDLPKTKQRHQTPRK